MTVLALRLAEHCNGVAAAARRHVARDVDEGLQHRPTRSDVPIGHDHQRRAHANLAAPRRSRRCTTSYLKPKWLGAGPDDRTGGRTRDKIPRRRAVGSAQTCCAAKLVGFVRERLVEQLIAPARPARRAHRRPRRCSTPDALTIGFARRFATYKRGTADLPRRQAPRAHPRTTRSAPCSSSSPAKRTRRTWAGRRSRRRSSATPREPQFRGRVVLLEDYDMQLGRDAHQRRATSGSTTRCARRKPAAPAA